MQEQTKQVLMWGGIGLGAYLLLRRRQGQEIAPPDVPTQTGTLGAEEKAPPSSLLYPTDFRIIDVKAEAWSGDFLIVNVKHIYNYGWKLIGKAEIDTEKKLVIQTAWHCKDWSKCVVSLNMRYARDTSYSDADAMRHGEEAIAPMRIPLCMTYCNHDDTYALFVNVMFNDYPLDVKPVLYGAYGEASTAWKRCNTKLPRLDASNQSYCKD